MKKYIVLFFSILSQSCIGGIYAWSVFAGPLQAEHSISKAQAGLIFGACIASFSLSMLLAGKLIQKINIRIVGASGGVLFASGYAVGSFSAGNFIMLLLGIGVVAGTGIGFSYICPLSLCVNWFPQHKGLITGLIVAGFGCGAMATVKIAEAMFSAGVPVLEALWQIGIGAGIIVFVSSMFFIFPDKKPGGQDIDIHPGCVKIFKNKIFLFLFLGMFSGTFGGLLIIGNLKPIGIINGLTPEAASFAVIVFSAGNTIGRIVWGEVFDRTGVFSIALCLMVLGLSALTMQLSGSPLKFYVNIIFFAFAFGGCFVLFVAQVATSFGISQVGSIYPFVFLAQGLAGVTGPSAGGWILENFSLSVVNWLVAVLAVSGAALFIKSKTFSKERN